MKKCIVFLLILCAAFALLPAAACASDEARTSYDIDCVYDDEAGTLTAECAVTYVNDTGTTLEQLAFNLYGNAYRQDALYKPVSGTYQPDAYYGGTSYGEMQITAVDGCDSWEVGGEDMNVLYANLSSPLKDGQSRTLTISYVLVLAEVNHRTGITEHTVNLGNFYPVACVWQDGAFYECVYYNDGDPFLSDIADYRVEITLPEGYTAAASGQLTGTAEDGALCYELNKARDFCLVLSDQFSTLTAESGGVQVTYYYYDDSSAQAKLDAAVASLEFFSGKFGEYVYPTLSVVQTGFAAGGMEYPALTMINDSLEEQNAIYTIVHENAHQWWYAMVGSNQIESAWQDEGLAEYSAALFFEYDSSYGISISDLINSAVSSYRYYFTTYNQIFGDDDTSMNRHLKDYVSDYEYVNIAYCKGMIMFDMLRSSIGDEKFYEGLQDYYKKYLYKTASPEDMFECFIGTGVDLESFFESFIEGKIII